MRPPHHTPHLRNRSRKHPRACARADAETAAVAAIQRRARWEMLLMGTFFVGFAAYYGWQVTIGISRPIYKAVAIANKMGHG